MFEIIGIDAGNNETKIYSQNGGMKFLSNIGEARERRLETNYGDDMIFEFKGKTWFGGTLAKYESEWNSSMMGDSKAHDELLIRVLIGLHRCSTNNNFKIVVGQPIGKHKQAYKKQICDLLKGKHQITLNQVMKEIEIEDVAVAAEGGSAFWSSPKRGLVRILDFGSGTVNGASLFDGKYIDKDSFSIKGGTETGISKDYYAIARSAATHALKKWVNDDQVFVVGGCADQMIEPLSDFFSNVKTLQPQDKSKGGISLLPPIYANAVGFYNIGRSHFNEE